MMRPDTCIIICLVALLFSSCVSQKNNDSFDLIIAGNGGGFTGMEKKYMINSKKEMFVSEGIQGASKTEKKGMMKKADFRELSKKIRSDGLKDIEYNKPGNIYYFIEIQYGGSANRITWSNHEQAPEAAREFYKYFTALF